MKAVASVQYPPPEKNGAIHVVFGAPDSTSHGAGGGGQCAGTCTVVGGRAVSSSEFTAAFRRSDNWDGSKQLTTTTIKDRHTHK